MTTAGLIILIALVFILVVIYMELAGMPGKTARARGHPQADAINMLGWLGLILGIAPWMFAMVWARMQSPQVARAVAPKRTEKADDQEAS